MNKYPLTLTAVKTNDSSQWDIGAALITECGPPSEDTIRDGSHARLAEAAAYLLNEGYKYQVQTLANMRRTAFVFTKSDRFAGIAFNAHRAAGTPEFLKRVVAGAPKGQKITQDYVEGIRSQIIEEQRRERQEAEAEARKEREKAEAAEEKARLKAREAKDKEEQEAAEQKLARAKAKTAQAKTKEQETKTAPKKKVVPPAQDEVPILAIRAGFLADAAHSVVLARKSVKAIKDRMHELTPKAITAMTEAAMEAANAWTEAARIVRSELVNESGHLSVVGE